MASLTRAASITAFLLRYRNSPVFGRTASTAEHSPEQAREFVEALERMGPLFVKLGQMLAGRYGEIPAVYVEALARLQDRSEPEHFAVIEAVIEQELRMPSRAMFKSIDSEPIGSASLGQVHRGCLRNGREVAIKVQKPQVALRMHEDLEALRGLLDASSTVQSLSNQLGLRDWLDEFSTSIDAELDYLLEAGNLVAFSRQLGRFPALRLPTPVWECCTSRVLVMDRLHGIRVDAIPPLRRPGAGLDGLAAQLGEAFLEQVMLHGFIHADLHAGNVLLTEDNQLAIFDVGMVCYLPPRLRIQLHRLVEAGLHGRGEAVSETYAHLCGRLENFDEPRFQQDVSRLVGRYALGSDHLRREGAFVLDLVAIGARRGLRPPTEIVMLGKALLTLEGVIRCLAPELSLRQLIETRLPELARRRSTDLLGLSGNASPWNELGEMSDLIRHSPRRLSQLLHTLAENRLKMQVVGLGDPILVEGVQKVANRISTGVIAAALIVAAALVMHASASTGRSSYPLLAVVMLAIAAVLGLALLTGSALWDRRARPLIDKDPL